MAGLVAALATIPTSIAYASIVGLNPLIGIWSSAILGFAITVVGGSPGLIAGSAGVVALPMAKLASHHGHQYILPTVLLASAIELLFGALKLGSLINLVSGPVIAGFINAFALFLVKSQFKVFTAAAALSSVHLLSAVGLAGISSFCMLVLPRLLRAPLPIPPSLLGLFLATAAARLMSLPVATLSSVVTEASVFAGGLSSLPRLTPWTMPSFASSSVRAAVVSAALGIAVISMLETLLASKLACSSYRCRTPGRYEVDRPDRLLLGLGLGNALTSVIGGFGGCGLIPNTLLNGRSGGLGYASQYAFAAFLALAVVGFAPLLGAIPVAAIAGIMLSVAVNTFEWAETAELLLRLKSVIAPTSVLPQQPLHHPQEEDSKTRVVTDVIAHVGTFVLCLRADMVTGVAFGVLATHLRALLAAARRRWMPAAGSNSYSI